MPHRNVSSRFMKGALPLIVALTVLWGTNWVLFPLAVREVSVWTFRAVCLLGSGLLVLAVARARGHLLRVPIWLLTLVTQSRMICASPAYLRAYGEPKTLRDVSAHRCVMGASKGPPLVWFVKEEGVEKRISPPATHQLSDAEAMLDAVINGLGLAQFPASLVRAALSDGRLKSVLQPFAPAGVEVHVLWPKRAHLSPRVRYIVDELLACAARGQLH